MHALIRCAVPYLVRVCHRLAGSGPWPGGPEDWDYVSGGCQEG